MAISSSHFLLLCVIGIVVLAKPAHAFGAGTIASTSKIAGQNWRHGDLENTLLTIVASKSMGGKKFGKLDVKRVYFGNWCRDYSQAIDVGTVKNVSAEAIRIILWVLGFMSFGYGTKEFEVTSERLGCYRPEEHIDNPKDYADNVDARQYDPRLRGPVNERRELTINTETGLKNYIASEGTGIDTSAGLVRNLFGRCIDLGRKYARSKNKADLYEALRLMGTGCHCLEDFSAHSNYVELALIEIGERDVFPHVGRRTQVSLREARREVYPIVTGTFGGVDFLHSVCGEFDDKATQSEIQELEGALTQAQASSGNPSMLQELLSNLPSGLFGGKNEAGKLNQLQQNSVQHQMQNTKISPRKPEEWVNYLETTRKQIYPILEWHDEIMQSITEMIEKIPVLPDLIEQVSDQINIFVFSLLAPYIVPIINQVKTELNTGSGEIIESSKNQQHVVFNDDHSSDPTHSMLSKDHFSNILNEPAGKVASQTVKWVVPQLMACWDDERIDIRRTLDRIIYGTLHHPALRDQGRDGASEGRRLMFAVVEKWWHEKDQGEKNELRRQLSREGVEKGLNHKPGVVDHGHGSAKPLVNFNNTQSGGNSMGGMTGAGMLGAITGGLTGTTVGSMLNTGYSGPTQQSFGQGQYGQPENVYGGGQQQYGMHGNQHHPGRQASGSGQSYGGPAEYGRYSEQPQFDQRPNRFQPPPSSSGGYGGGYGRDEDMPGGFGGGGNAGPGFAGRFGGGRDDYNTPPPGGFGGNEYSRPEPGRFSQGYSGGGDEYNRRPGEYGGDEYQRQEPNRFQGYGGGGYEPHSASRFGGSGGDEFDRPIEGGRFGRYGRDNNDEYRRNEDRIFGGYGGGRRDGDEGESYGERRGSGGGHRRRSRSRESNERRGSYGRRELPEEDRSWETERRGVEERRREERYGEEQREERYEEQRREEYEERDDDDGDRRDDW